MISMKNITFTHISWTEVDAVFVLMSYKVYKNKII